MRKTLLFLIAGFISTCLSAQITLPKTWDFNTWTLSSGIGQETATIDELGIYAGTNSNTYNTGTVTNSNYTFSDNFASTKRFQLNGAGYTSGNFSTTPTQRYIYFDVDGKADVKIWYRGGGSGSRILYVTDGTSILAQQASVDQAGVILTAQKTTTGSGRIYIFGDTAVNLMKIEVTENTSLSVANGSKISTNIFANGSQVHVKGISSETNISVHSMNGSLVKTLSSKSDFAFDLKPGIYIINATSPKGKVSQKVIVK